MTTTLDRLASLRVADVMSRQVVTVAAHQTMAEAAAIFTERKISGAPVLDEQGHCIGMLSSGDFVCRECAEAAASSTLTACEKVVVRAGYGPWQIEDVFQDRVAAHMSPAVQSVDAQMPLVEAGRILCAQHIHRLPVLDPQGHPIGMITSLDVVAAVVKAIDEGAQARRQRRAK